MKKKWSGEVTKHSNALDLDTDVFKGKNLPAGQKKVLTEAKEKLKADHEKEK